MLTKSKRLRSAEVEQVMKSGRSLRSAHLQVKFVVTDGYLRSAAVVPKSLVRKASSRNLLRRALYRALAAQNMANNKANIKGSAVFFVRVVPKERPTAVFAEELTQLLSKLS
jgi:ribonuclease P protein component